MSKAAKLVDLKETIKYYYEKYSQYIRPVCKLLFTFIALNVICGLFPYGAPVNRAAVLLAVSVAAAFLPSAFLFYAASVLIACNLWKVSLEIFGLFIVLVLAFYLVFVRLDSANAWLVILMPVLFSLKLEYLLPVILGMVVGMPALFPVAAGILVYFLGSYTADASALMTTSASSEVGIGIQRVVNLISIDRELLVVLVAFTLVILISCLLNRLFHENAWLFSVVLGNVALAFLLLSGKLIFELDYAVWRVLLETVLAMALATVVQFFRGIGDVSRMEKVSFEDDDYIYYVKAVPKIKAARPEKNVTDIKPEETGETESMESGRQL